MILPLDGLRNVFQVASALQLDVATLNRLIASAAVYIDGMSRTDLKVGEIARRAGVSRDTVRYYEKLGLVPRAARTASGYRQYPESAVERIRVVRNASRFGFSLNELATFFRACARGSPPCRSVRAAGARLLGALEQQIAELTATRDATRATLRDWDDRLSRTPAGEPARLLEMLNKPS